MKKKQISTTNIVVAVSAVVGIIATFLPWMSASVLGITLSASGTEGNGLISLFMFIIILGVVAYSVYKKADWAKICISIAAGIALLIAIINLIDGASNGFTIGFGLILVIIAALVCGIMPWIPMGKKPAEKPAKKEK